MLNWSATRYGSKDRERVVITAGSRDTLLAEIKARLEAGRGFSVATLNLDHVVKLRSDPAFARAYSRMSHVTADGNPIVWLSWLAGTRSSSPRDRSSSIRWRQRRRGPACRWRFVGTTDAALASAAETLAGRHPGLSVALKLAPSMGFDAEGPEADAAIERIGASGAGVCILALGAPKQEIFAARAQERLPRVGFLSVGAGLDFVAGTQVRAPALVRALAAEWLWRLGTDPRRLARRYASCLAILPGLAHEALSARRSRA